MQEDHEKDDNEEEGEVLDNQITLMLNQVLEEDITQGNEKLSFSNDEEDEDNREEDSDKGKEKERCGYEQEMYRQQEMMRRSIKSNKNSSEMNGSHSFNKYQRMEKKFGTISFNNINNINMNMQMMYSMPMQYHQQHQHQHQQHQQQQLPHNTYMNNPNRLNSTFCASPLACHPIPIYNNNNHQQQQQVYSPQIHLHPNPSYPLYNSISPRKNSHHTPMNPNTSTNINPKFQRTNTRKNTYDYKQDIYHFNQGLFPNNTLHNPSPSTYNTISEETNISASKQQNSTDLKTEILLADIHNSLSKTDKIDHHIFNKLQGNFAMIIQTQKGSRIFQNYLRNTHSEIIHQIFLEINPLLSSLMSDSYANYFCKRFFTYLNQKDRTDLLHTIKDSLVRLSLDSIATYPIQGIIEQVGSKIEKKIIITSLKGDIQSICLDTYGSHVLEKIISYFEEEFVGFIYDYVIENFMFLSNHVNGICLVKKIMTLTHKKDLHESIKTIILTEQNALDLIQNLYGNNVIQAIIECWDDLEIEEIIRKFHMKFTVLSMQKYSSNVVERCIEKSHGILGRYINEICSDGRIGEIMKNSFGNYVIQNALRISLGNAKMVLVEAIVKNVDRLNDKKLIAKWKMIVMPHVDNENNALLGLLKDINE